MGKTKQVQRISVSGLMSYFVLPDGPIEQAIVTDKGKDLFVLVPMDWFKDDREPAIENRQ